MLKILLCLVSGLLIAVLMLQLRQQQWELQYQANQLHGQIQKQQAKLWDQQLQIAVYTAPNAITRTVSQHDLKLAPAKSLAAGTTHWVQFSDGTGRDTSEDAE